MTVHTKHQAGRGREGDTGRRPCPWGAALVWVLPEAAPKDNYLSANNVSGR